jgi:hypothetical protein
MDWSFFILSWMVGSDNEPVIQAAAEKPEKSRYQKNCLAMKKMELEQMEDVNGGMSCGMALALYGAALIGAAGATGGLFIAVGLATLGGSIWTAFESCHKTL